MNDVECYLMKCQYEELFDMMHKKYSDDIHHDKISRKIVSELK